MAEDRLIFGIGFDLDDAVKDAEKDFNKVIKDLQTVANNKPLKLSVETDLKSIKAAEGSISALREEMARLSKAWNNITNTAKFNDDGTLTKEAKELANQYMAATDSISKYGMTLEQITRARKQAIVDEQKAEEKRYQEWLRNKQQEATENERIERQKQAATARTIAEQNKEYARQAAAEEKRQAAISSSLRSEYKRIELKQQEEAASRRELQMLNERLRKESQIAAATKNQSMQAAYNARRKAGLALKRTLQAEENSISAINAKLQIQRQRLNEVDMGSEKFKKIAAEVERLSKKLSDANNRVAKLTGQVVIGQNHMTSAVQETNHAYSSTEGYINRLIKRTLVLFGIRQVVRFAERLREVTAEFELQRVSLGAIIQDTEKANALFSQIKTFAVQSPFEIKDLVGYVKQLSAYRIETDKLFDTTKRLADVSAGLGTDMSRLILAYGQVRAASVLRGQEVRQFTEAGIPLIELLAEKFTALRGEMVSTSEVFDLISQRAVSFQMVAEIFEDMTNAGGIFYNMQEKQAQTLAGQWSNLKDSLSIMYDEMGRTATVNKYMQTTISLVKSLASNWEAVGNVIKTIGVGYGIYWLATKDIIPFYKLNNKQILDNIKSEKALEAQRIKTLAIGRKLTTEEQRRLLLTKQLRAADYQRYITEAKLTDMQLIQLARQSANNKQLVRAIIQTKRLTAEQVKNIQSMSRWNLAGIRLGNMFRNLGRSIGAAFKTFWPIALISSAIELISDYRAQLQEQKKAEEDVQKAYEERGKQLQRIETEYRAVQKAALNAKDADEAFAKETYADKLKALQEIKKMLSTFGLQNNIDLSVVDMDNIDSVLNAWLDKLDEANQLSKRWGITLADVATAFEGNIMGWSIFGENLNSDMKDLANSWKNLTTNKRFKDDLERMQLYVARMANNEEEFYEQLSKAVGEDAKLALSARRRNESDLQYWQRILKNYDIINSMAQRRSIGFGFNSFFDATALKEDFKSDLNEVMHELAKTKDDWEGKDPVSIKMAIDQQFLLHQWDDTIKELVIQEANKRWQLNIPVKFEAESTPEVPQGFRQIITTEFPKLFSEDELKNIGTVGGIVDAINGKLEEAEKNLRNAYKVQNNTKKSATDYESVLADINKQIEAEQAKDVTQRDEQKLNALRAQVDAIANANAEFDKQIELQRASAQAAVNLAKAAKERIVNVMLSTVAEDVKTTFPALMQDAIKSITDKDYNIDFTISDSDLETVKDQADLFDLWVNKMKALADAKEKVRDVRISDATIERERAELTQRQAEAEQELLTVEQKLADSKYQQIHDQYKQLKYNLAVATSAEDIQQAQEALKKFLQNNTNTEYASLLIQQQKLKTILAIKKTTGELTNEQIDAYNKLIETQEKELQALGERYNFTMPEKTKGGAGEDPWITLMKNRMSFMKDFQKGVDDLSKYMQKNLAIGQEQDIMLFRGKSLDIDVSELNGSKEELVKWYDDAIEEVSKKIAKLGGKTWEGLGVQAILSKDTKSKMIKKYQELLQELFNAQTDFKTDKLKKSLETELKRLADEVSRTKVAKEFFDKMLNMTGNRELSATVTMSVYGGTGDELKQRIIDQIRNAFQTTTGDELDLSLAINYNTLEVNYLKLAQLAEQNKDILLEASKDTRDGIIKAGLETTAARIAQWEKDIQKDQTYSEKRIRLAQETAQKIADIDVSNIPDAEKKRLQEGYRQREQEQAADLAWNAFKDSPMYVQMFDKLETASTTMLNAMLDKLKQLKAQWGESLSPTELKELQSRMNEIESQLANKNPFKTLADAIKEYRTLTKEKSYKESVQELAKNMQQADIEAGKYAEALRLAQEAEQRYIEIKKEKGDNSDEAKNAKKAADEAWNQARAQQSVADKAQKVANKSQKTVDAYKQCADKAKAAGSALGEWTDKLNVAFDGIRNIMDAFGASDEDMQFFDDIVGGFNKVSQGAQQGAMAVASFMSGDILGGATNAIGSIGNIISGFTDIFYAGRIRRANKEIKRQQEIIDALEYSYSRLQKTVDKLFGSEYIANFRKQQDNLRAEIVATEKQLEAEKSKGKKKDKDKIKDYKDSIRDLKDQLEDLIGTLSQQMLGTDLASAARSFAQSWLDAYKEFGDTRKAIEDEMQKMMENLIVESVLGAVMQKALEPVFKMIDEMGTSDFYDDNFWTKIVDEMNKSTDNALTGASVITAKLEKAGINIRDLGSDFTGISKDIASASEESILGLSSNILTQNYYISHIDTTVSQILAMMSGGGTDFSSNEQIADLITIQNQHLAYLPNIALNTAQTAERCERAAAACENIAENLNRVIKPNGVQGSYRVNTSL